MAYKIFQQSSGSVFFVFIYLSGLLFVAPAMAADDEAQLINNDIKLFEKAVQLSLQQKWPQAELIYRDLISRDRPWPEPGNNLAVLLLKTDRLDEAKQMLEKAVSSSPGYRIAQKNRSQLYNYLATQAYDKALGAEKRVAIPELELIRTIYQPVKIIEKKVEVIVAKPVRVAAASEKTPPSESEQNSQKDVSNQIKQQLLAWSNAWSKGDFKRYITSYSAEFIPSDNQKTYAQWKNIRKARLKFIKGVNVNIEQLRVFIEPEGEFALVEFLQTYQSATYNDQVLKQLYMKNQQDNWTILSERTIKTY